MHIQIGPVMAAQPPPGHYHALFPTSLTFISVTPSDDHLFVQSQLPASKAPLPNLSPRAPRLRWAPGLKHAFSHCHVSWHACVSVSWGVLLQILTSEMSRLTPGISGVLLWRFASHDQISHVRSHLRYAAHTINRPRTWMKWMWYWDFSKVIFIQGITWQKINMLCE